METHRRSQCRACRRMACRWRDSISPSPRTCNKTFDHASESVLLARSVKRKGELSRSIARNSRKTNSCSALLASVVYIYEVCAISNSSVFEQRKYTTLRYKNRNYLTFILSLARWPGVSSSSRLDIVEYNPCCSKNISESGFTWKNQRLLRNVFSSRPNCIESNFPIPASGKRMNRIRRDVPPSVEPSIHVVTKLEYGWMSTCLATKKSLLFSKIVKLENQSSHC